MTSSTVESRDGTAIYVRTWAPSGVPRGEAAIVHGLGDHGGRYEHIARALVAAGLRVHALDLRGFGRSAGRRAFVDDWSRYFDDLDAVLDDRCDASRPFVLYGHSLGGLVALTYVLAGRRRPARLVLSAPALDAEVSGAKRLMARVVGRLAPRVTLRNDITGDQLARDPAVGEDYFGDPLVLTRTTTGLGREFLRAMESARTSLSDLTVPTLVVHGGQDTLVPTWVSEPLEEVHCVERIVLPGMRHEWHNEPGESDAALATVVDWVLVGT
jgi:alpha-beta hydrolase superfamily lysophospholipase